MSRVQFSAWLGLALVAVVVSPGCSCGSDAYGVVGSGESGGEGGEGGEGGGPHVTVQGTGGGGGEGGQPGGDTTRGIAAGEMVSAGEIVRSPGYRMIFTLGQPTQIQGKTTSPSYRMQGGLVGANGSLP